MGGFGSGRGPTAHEVVENCWILDVNHLKRQGFLQPGRHIISAIAWTSTRTGEVTSSAEIEADALEARQLWIAYTFSDSGKAIRTRVPLTTTAQHLGGVRWWMRCPDCGRRVGKLYRPPWGDTFSCRHCWDLTYTSCLESHKWDAFFAHIAPRVGWTVREMVQWTREMDRRNRRRSLGTS